MKEIELTQGKVAIVDDEDYEWLSNYKWNLGDHNKSEKYIYAFTRIYVEAEYGTPHYYLKKKQRKSIFMHRMIMDTPEDLIIDHINHNTLDNRKANLRNTTYSQNMINSYRDKPLSGYRGVTAHKKKYAARISINGKDKRIGSYRTAKEAGKAFNKAAQKHYGKYAQLNEID